MIATILSTGLVRLAGFDPLRTPVREWLLLVAVLVPTIAFRPRPALVQLLTTEDHQ